MRLKSVNALLLSALLGLFLLGCVGGSKDTPEETAKALKAYILDKAPPDMGKKLNINYDNKITLLGAKVTPNGPVKPGKRVKVTMYWKVEKEIGEPGWKLFTHILDGSGERILNIDNVGPLRRVRQGEKQALPPSQWKKGKVYVDEQHFTVPRKIKTKTAQVVVGIWKGDDRLPIVSGPRDRQNRGIVANVRTEPGAKRPPLSTRVPQLRVDRLEKGTKIKIDGKLDEKAWKTAPKAGPFVDVRTGRLNKQFPVQGSAKILWDKEAMYLGFDVQDKDIVGGFDKKEKDPHLWTKDTVEIMVDPDGDGDNRDYYEIQINPQNLVFDSRFDSYNQPKKGPDGPFGHEDWSSKVESAVTVKGTLDKPGDKDEGYVVEARIPWSAFNKAKTVPPEVGQTWRMNFYAMEKNSGVAWSAILGQGNFHRASRFGKVTWAEKGWTPPLGAASSAKPGEGKPGDEAKKAAAPAGSGKAAQPSGTKKKGVKLLDPKKQKPRLLKP